jgi:hydrogenase maturation protease
VRDALPAAQRRSRLSETIVIGVGNRWRGDDGAGLAVADRLREGPGLPGVRVVDHEGEPLTLLDAWSPASTAIVIDAMRSGAPPGRVHRLVPLTDDLPVDGWGRSTHAFGVVEAIELARVLDRLPARLEVYGIQGARFTAGAGLTPPVAHAVDAVTAELRRRLGALG